MRTITRSLTAVIAAFWLIAAGYGFDPYAYGPYRVGISNPEETLGFQIGDRLTTYREQELFLKKLAEQAGGRMVLREFGRSTEGRPLRIAIFSDPTNIARLEELRGRLFELANPKPGADMAALAKDLPSVLWINETIHGNETASFESGMWSAYTLAASEQPALREALKHTIVIINPVYNPDGHERFAVHNNSVAIGSSDRGAFEALEPDLVHGRTNHYRFDMNRDRVAMSQTETRQEVAEFLRWNPHIYLDQHGQTREYFFPPNPMAVNANTDRARIAKWTEIFGRAWGKAFDKQGWLYFIKSEFDLYYAGYLDSFTSLTGAIGMTHETDGGFFLNRLKDDGTSVTLRSGAAKHFTTAMTAVTTIAANRESLLASYADFKHRAVTGEHAGKFRRVVATSPDPRPLIRLADHLARAGVKSFFAKAAWNQSDANDYWTKSRGKQAFAPGSLVIDMNQAQGPLAKSLLEPGQDFEPEFSKRQTHIFEAAKSTDGADGDPEFYDMTGWSLIYGYGVSAWWCESTPEVPAAPPQLNPAGAVSGSDVGWAIRYRDRDDILALYELLDSGVRVMVATKPMKVGNLSVDQGTFIVLAGRNEIAIQSRLQTWAGAHPGVMVDPLPSAYPEEGKESPGADSVQPLSRPRIGILFGKDSESITNFGAIWYLMEREYKLPFTPLASRALAGDLSRFSTIVLPAGAGADNLAKLKEWVSGGGSLVVFGLSGALVGKSGLVDLDSTPEASQSLPGSFFATKLKLGKPMTYGYTREEFAVNVGGSSFYKAKGGGDLLTLPEKAADVRLLSGWTWGAESDKSLAGATMVRDIPMGRGRIVAFMVDPSERAMFPAYDKLVLNAMILGPSRSGRIEP